MRGFALAKLEIVAAIGFGTLVGVLAILSGREEILKQEGFGSRDGPGMSVSRGLTGVFNVKTCSGFLGEVGVEISGANGIAGGAASCLLELALGSAASFKQGDGCGCALSLRMSNARADVICDGVSVGTR